MVMDSGSDKNESPPSPTSPPSGELNEITDVRRRVSSATSSSSSLPSTLFEKVSRHEKAVGECTSLVSFCWKLSRDDLFVVFLFDFSGKIKENT